jgi:hypothetical protein
MAADRYRVCTYSPAVAWSTTRFFFIQALLNGWHMRQIDYVMAYPQAPVERDLYMYITAP